MADSTPNVAPSITDAAPGPRWWPVGLGLLAVAVFAGGGAWLWLHLTGRSWNMIDLSVYQWGGALVRSSQSLYNSSWDGSQIANYHDGPLPFTYTPLAALVFVPLSYLSLTALQVLAITADVAALAVVTGICLRLSGYRRDRGMIGLSLAVGVLALALEPVSQTVFFGQINILLMVLVLADLAQPDDRRCKGVGVGFAMGLKLTPAIFVAYLLITRRWAAAGRAAGVFAATVALGFAVRPHDSARFWGDRLFLDAGRVGGVELVSNQSLNGALTRALGSTAAARPAWLVLAAVTAGVGLLLAARLSRQGHELAAIVSTAATGLLVSPISWSHHWVWVVPALVLGIDGVYRHRPGARALLAGGVVIAAALPFVPGLIWRVPWGGGAEYGWSPAETIGGNLYVLGTLVALGALAWRAWQRSPVTVSEPDAFGRRRANR